MDPATIIGTTSAVLSFVTFIGQTIQVGRKIWDNANEVSESGDNEYKQCKKLHQAFKPSLKRLKEEKLAKGEDALADAERSLLSVLSLCESLATEVINLMENYEYQPAPRPDPNGKHSRWKRITRKIGIAGNFIKITLRVLWEEEEAKDLRERFNACAAQLNIHLTGVYGSEILEKADTIANGLKTLQNVSTSTGAALLEDMKTLIAESGKLSRTMEAMAKTPFHAFGQKIDELSKGQKKWFEEIAGLQKTLSRVFKVSVQSLEDINRRRILKAVSFESRQARQIQIGQQKLAPKTFEWFIKPDTLDDDKTKVSEAWASCKPFWWWLEKGRGIYHISGKPGSGKSTLMNFLQKHKVTKARLRRWMPSLDVGFDSAPDGTPVEEKLGVASVFLYRAGTSEKQKTIDGVRRTLLHAILERYRPDLISRVFKRHWNPTGWSPLYPVEDIELDGPDEDCQDSNEITTAFEAVLQESKQSGWRYCFFIDGADEFRDLNMDVSSFAEELKRWATDYPENVKICVSSREEFPWTGESFCSSETRIRIHDFTKTDMKALVEERIGHYKSFQSIRMDKRESFIAQVVRKANGVFLWTRNVLDLVAEQLRVDGLEKGELLETLHDVLQVLPVEMEDVIKKIYSDIPKVNLEESKTILRMMMDMTDPNRGLGALNLTLYDYSMVRDLIKDPDFGQTPKMVGGEYMAPACGGETDSASETRVNSFKGRLAVILRGLVDVVPESNRSELGPIYLRATTHRCQFATTISDRLAFTHRSVYEYLSKEPEIRAMEGTTLMMIKCITAQVNLYWCLDGIDVMGPFMCHRILGIVSHIDETPFSTEVERGAFINSLLLSLENLDRARKGSIFSICALLFRKSGAYYVRWKANRFQTSASIISPTGQAAILHTVSRAVVRYHFSEPYRSYAAASIRTLLEAGFDPNAEAFPWISFLEDAVSNYYVFSGDKAVWRIIDTFLQYGAERPVSISWTLNQADSRPKTRLISAIHMLGEKVIQARIRKYEGNLSDSGSSVEDSSSSSAWESESEYDEPVARPFAHAPLHQFTNTTTEKIVPCLKQHFPHNKATLKELFQVFGPKDEPDIAARLEALYPDTEITQQDSEPSNLADENPPLEKPTGTTEAPPGTAQKQHEAPLQRGVDWKSTVLALALGGVIGAVIMYRYTMIVGRAGKGS